MKLIIGLVGENGSGKGMFIDLLKEIAAPKNVVRIASSDLLNETLNVWDIERTRRALQDLAIIMNGHFGDGTLSHAVEKRIKETKGDIIVFDGMRWPSDVEMLKTFPHTLLVYITADLKIRYERTKKRKEKVGESSTPFEQFLIEEKIKTELEIPSIGAQADAKIENNGTVEEYRKKIEKFYKDKVK